MKKITMFMLTIAMALMLSVSTASAWFVSLEPISTPPGCEAVATGETFYADVFFNPDEGGSNYLNGYQFAIEYDTTELTWISATAAAQHTPPSPLIMGFGAPNDGGPGLARNWTAIELPPGSGSYITEKTQLAHIEFDAHPDMYCDGVLDVWFGEDPGGDQIFQVNGEMYDYLSHPEYIVQGPSVSITGTPVPIPGAALLFGSGLLGLVGIGRRRLSA